METYSYIQGTSTTRETVFKSIVACCGITWCSMSDKEYVLMEYVITALFLATWVGLLILCKRIEKLEDYTRVKAVKKILKKALKVRKRYDKENKSNQYNKIDPFCLIHGKKMSEHVCLYCCLCYKNLTLEECNVRADGKREDVCVLCAKQEAEEMKKRGIER